MGRNRARTCTLLCPCTSEQDAAHCTFRYAPSSFSVPSAPHRATPEAVMTGV